MGESNVKPQFNYIFVPFLLVIASAPECLFPLPPSTSLVEFQLLQINLSIILYAADILFNPLGAVYALDNICVHVSFADQSRCKRRRTQTSLHKFQSVLWAWAGLKG